MKLFDVDSRRFLLNSLVIVALCGVTSKAFSDESYEVLSTDFNNDGLVDLVLKSPPRKVKIPYDITVNLASDKNSYVLIDNGDGTYDTNTITDIDELNGYSLANTDYGVQVGDFNGDGETDFLLTSPTDDSLIFSSHDDGNTLEFERRFTNEEIPGDSSVTVTDLDGDGNDDLVVSGDDEQKIGLSGADGRFQNLNGSGSASGVAVTTGTANVGNDGSANYHIPVVSPPGVAGLEPSISIGYSSTAGSDYLGVGWNIGGLQTIHRCKPIIPIDGRADATPLSNDERFCLNGARLIAISGSYGEDGAEYRTEVDQFSKIKSYGQTGSGPTYFKVWTKAGLELEFGSTADSRVAPANQSTAYKWSVNKVSDQFGNNYNINYVIDGTTGDHYPDFISYNPDARIDFEYEDRGTSGDRKDVLWRFHLGSEVSVTKRLRRITTSVEGNPVRHYELGYESSSSTGRDRITEVTECAYGVGGSPSCARPVTLDWQEGESGFEDTPTTLLTVTREIGYQPLMFDANGDGYTDLVWAHNWEWWIAEGSAEGFSSPINTQVTRGARKEFAAGAQPMLLDENGKYGLLVVLSADYDVPLVAGGDPVDVFDWGVITFEKLSSDGYQGTRLKGTIVSTLGAKPIVGDFNGDGRDDIFGYIEDYMVEGLNNYYEENDVWHDESKPGIPETAKNAFVALRTEEPFKDGSIGFFVHYSDGVADGFNQSSNYSLAGSFSTDIDGDGRDNVVAKRGGYWNKLTPSRTGETVQDKHGNWHEVYGFSRATTGIPVGDGESGNGTMTDLNQDGLPDMLVRRSNEWKAYINDGRIFRQFATGLSTTESNPSLMPINFDNDGNTDFLVKTDNGWDIYSTYIERNNVSLQRQQQFSVGGGFYTGERPSIADVNGDGLEDVLYFEGDAWKAFLHNNGKPDLLVGVTDGAGVQTKFGYLPTSNPDVHTFEPQSCGYFAVETSCFPYRSIRTGFYVVDELESSNGKGGFNRKTYHYRGAKVHLQGRGFLGFAERTETDHQLGTVSRREFAQAFPFSGRTTEVEIKKGAHTLFKEDYFWERRTPYAGKPIQLPYLDRKTSQAYDSGLISASITEYEVDDYGNVTSEIQTVGKALSGDSVSGVESQISINRDYRPPEIAGDQWRIGFLEEETVTAGSLVQKTTFEPWQGTTLVGSKTENADTSKWRTTTYQYTGVGNLSTTTVSAAEAPTRDVNTNSDWDRNLLPQTIENAKGHSTGLKYEKRYGQAIEVTDANGLKHTARYDNWGRMVYQKEADGTETHVIRSWCESSCPQSALFSVTTITKNADASGMAQPPVTTYLDAFGREVRKSTRTLEGRHVSQDVVYDELGRKSSESLPYFKGGTPKWSNYQNYDVYGRPLRIEHPDGSYQTFSFGTSDEFSRLAQVSSTVVKPDGRKYQQRVEQHYNSLGLLAKTLDARGTPTNYSYDEFGRPRTFMVNGDPETKIEVDYDEGGNQRYLIDPNAGRIDYKFDGLGQLVRQTDAKGQVTSFDYDVLGRIVARTDNYEGPTGDPVQDQNIWEYDTAPRGLGLPARITGPDFEQEFQYDTLSRLSRRSTQVLDQAPFVFKYQYDAFSRPESVTYPSGFAVKAQYNGLGYRTGIVSANSSSEYWTATEMDVFGQIKEEHFGNGLTTRRTFNDTTGFLESLETKSGRKVFQSHSYSHDTNGNLRSREAVIGGQKIIEKFRYDVLDRLTNSTTTNLASGTRSLDVQYDELGNITYKQGVSDVDGYTYGSSRPNAVTKVVLNGSTTNYEYDANGSVIKSGQRDLAYNNFNKPIYIKESNKVSEFRYGPTGMRFYQEYQANGEVKRKTFYASSGLYEKTIDYVKGEIKEKSYVAGLLMHIQTRPLVGVAIKQNLHYLHKDILGSTEVITDAFGKRVQQLAYAPFGDRRNPDWTDKDAVLQATLADLGFDLTPRGYTDHEHLDEFSLIHMNGRVYDPVIGRFLSPDPFVQAPGFSQSFNRYSYALNNPMSAIDPSGYNSYSSGGGVTMLPPLEVIAYRDPPSIDQVDSYYNQNEQSQRYIDRTSGGNNYGSGTGVKASTNPANDVNVSFNESGSRFISVASSGGSVRDNSSGQTARGSASGNRSDSGEVRRSGPTEADAVKIQQTGGTRIASTRAGDSGSDSMGPAMAQVLPVAVAAAAADGPVPIGDLLGGALVLAALAVDESVKIHLTYTLTNSVGVTYVGRTSGYGDPYSIMMRRYNSHHMKALGFGNPTIDAVSAGITGRIATRGREQQKINSLGGVSSAYVGNKIRGVSVVNPLGRIYHDASSVHFGEIAEYDGLF